MNLNFVMLISEKKEHKRQVNVCKGMIVGVKEGEKVKQINLTNIIKERDMEITTLKW